MTAHREPARDARVEPRVEPRGDRNRTVPEATVARLAVYLRALTALVDEGMELVSSDELSTIAGVNSAMLRKDLSYLGSIGTRGVGYDVTVLRERIVDILGLTERRSVVLVGIGNLGHALAGYDGFSTRGFGIAGLFDADRMRVGEKINDLYVQPMENLAGVVAGAGVTIGIIATPAAAAQAVADQLVAVGVTSILNFAPTVISVPDDVDVRKVDLAVELQILSFHVHRRANGNGASTDGLPAAQALQKAEPLKSAERLKQSLAGLEGVG